MDAASQRLKRAKSAAAALTNDGSKRKWLSAELKSYGDDSYTARLHILEGTPPRAYIVECAEREVCTVLDMDGQLFGEARDGQFGPVRWVPRGRRK